MRLRRALLLIFCLLAGAVVGALLASVCAGVSGLSWLAFSRTIGFSPDAPFVLDLSAVRFSFGFAVDLSVAQVITIAASIIAYNAIIKRKK